jgi:NADH-quinone oxidoreductase subunit D
MNQESSLVEMMINMGPQHPSTHGVFRMVLKIDGERIVDVEPHIGYLHRGSEKLSESETYSQVVTLFDRLDYVSNFNNELVFCMAVEKLMSVDVPERAQYLRIILCELNRIASHLLFYGTYGLDAGAITPIMYSFRERERIQNLFESVTGARMMHNFIRIGGLKEDVPTDFNHRVGELLVKLSIAIDECDTLLSQNEIFLSRTKGVGVIGAEEALAIGMTGPPLRASGVVEDVRATDPYQLYDRFDFGIPVGTNGDAWDRYYVPMEEMRQAIVIIEQALEQIESGPVIAQLRRIIRPPQGAVFAHAENPRGDLGVYLVSDGTNKPYRVKVRPPSFCNLQALKTLLRGTYLADAVIILGSLDIILGEVDR